LLPVDVFWVMTPYSVVVGYQHFRGLRCLRLQGDLWSAGILPQHYTALQPRRHRF